MRIFLSVIVLILASCFGGTDLQNENKVKLIKSSNVFVMDLGEETLLYQTDRVSFIKPYTSIAYSNDTVFLTTLHEVNSCGKTIGEIEYYRDTLFLLNQHIGGRLCNSVEYHKFSYVVYMPKKGNLNVQF